MKETEYNLENIESLITNLMFMQFIYFCFTVNLWVYVYVYPEEIFNHRWRSFLCK